jgi:uncharacterized protein YndB with AHSA1/START domain
MADLDFSIDIAAAPNEVFAFFVPQRMPLWYGTEMNACFEVERGVSEFAAGQKVHITGHLKGHAVTLTAIISAYEWEKVLEWQFEDSYGVRGFQSWELTPAERVSDSSPASRNAPGLTSAKSADAGQLARATRVRMRDSYRMPGLYGRIVDVILTRFAVSMRDRSWLDRLDRLVSPR